MENILTIEIGNNEQENLLDTARTEDLSDQQFLRCFAETDREREIIGKLKGAGAHLLEGPRGVGKSSLLKKAELELDLEFHKSHVVGVYVSFKASLLVESGNGELGYDPFLCWVAAKVLDGFLKKCRTLQFLTTEEISSRYSRLFSVSTGWSASSLEALVRDLQTLTVAASPQMRQETVERLKAGNLAQFTNAESVAEFVIAAVLEASRGLEEGKQRGRNGNYSEDGIKARELKNSEFGIIGLGNIGTRVAELASGFGAKISYWSQSKKNSPFTSTNLDRLVEQSDFLSLNIALTPETKHILNAERINNIKAGAIVINTCPMDLVDLGALAARLAKNDITFILDHSDEMSAEDLAKLLPHKNAIVYPPMAYISVEACRNKGKIFVANISASLEGSSQNRVN